MKMEGAGATVDRARAVIAAGIPVMGHVGLTPQQTGDREGFRVHGKTADAALEIIAAARRSSTPPAASRSSPKRCRRPSRVS